MAEDHGDREAEVDRERLQAVPRRLRDAVYRPDADDADRIALAGALAEHPPRPESPSPVPPRRRRGRRTRVLLGVAVCVILGSTALALQGIHQRVPAPPRSPTRSPEIATTAVGFLGDVEDRDRQRLALRRLFDTAGSTDLRAFLLDHGFAGAVDDAPDARRVAGAATGSGSFDVGRLAGPPRPTKVIVLLTCSSTSPVTWRLVSPGVEHDDPTSATGRGSDCAGRILLASVPVAQNRTPTRFAVAVRPGVRVLFTVLAAGS